MYVGVIYRLLIPNLCVREADGAIVDKACAHRKFEAVHYGRIGEIEFTAHVVGHGAFHRAVHRHTGEDHVFPPYLHAQLVRIRRGGKGQAAPVLRAVETGFVHLVVAVPVDAGNKQDAVVGVLPQLRQHIGVITHTAVVLAGDGHLVNQPLTSLADRDKALAGAGAGLIPLHHQLAVSVVAHQYGFVVLADHIVVPGQLGDIAQIEIHLAVGLFAIDAGSRVFHRLIRLNPPADNKFKIFNHIRIGEIEHTADIHRLGEIRFSCTVAAENDIFVLNLQAHDIRLADGELFGGGKRTARHTCAVLKNFVADTAVVGALHKENAVFGVLAQFDDQVGITGGLPRYGCLVDCALFCTADRHKAFAYR